MRKILILPLGFVLSLGAQAKDYHRTAGTTTVVCRPPAGGISRPLKPSYMKGVLVAPPWTDNQLVQTAGGTTVFLGRPLGCNNLFGRMKPAFSVSIDEWFAPSVGGRLNCNGMRFNDYNNSSQDYQYLRAGFIWGVLGNLYKNGVHTLARWSVIPYVGVGILCNKVSTHKPLTIFYGIQGQYHLSPHITVTTKMSSMTTTQDSDGYGKTHHLGDHLLSTSLGFLVRIDKTGWRRVIDTRPYIVQNEQLSTYASSFSDSSSCYHAQHDRGYQTLEQLRKILAIEGLLGKYGYLFFDNAASSVTNGYPRNDYSSLDSLRMRMGGRYDNGQKTKVMESTSCTEGHGNAGGEPEDGYLSLIRSGKTCISVLIYFFFGLDTDRLLGGSQLVNLDEVARIAKKYGLKVKVIGTADSATGSEAINDNLNHSRTRFIAEELMKRGMENDTISQIFDGGIDDYSPNEANHRTRILLYLQPDIQLRAGALKLLFH